MARRVEADPRVVLGSVRPKLLKWDEKSIDVEIFWRFIDVDQPMNLVLQYDKKVGELVIDNARYDAPETYITE